MTERAMMALFDVGHRLSLPGDYWIQKSDDNRWQVGKGEMFLGFSLDTNVPCGPGGSFDAEAQRFSEELLEAVMLAASVALESGER
jgi:hypothetical protein